MAGNPLLALQVETPVMGQQPDIAGAFQAGQEQRQKRTSERLSTLIQNYQLKKAQDADAQQNTLRQFNQDNGPGILAGDENSLAGLARIDPNAAIETRTKLDTSAKARIETAQKQIEFIGAQANSILNAPAEYRPILYSRAKAQARSLGIDISNAPDQYSDAAMKQLAEQSLSAKEQLDQHWKGIDEKRQADTLSETVRSHKAEEGNRAATLAETAARMSPEYQAKVEGAKESAKLKAQSDAMGAGGDEITQSHIDNVMSGVENMNNVPMARRDEVSKGIAALQRADENGKLPPIAMQRITTAASKIVSPYVESSQYKLAANGLPYIERIHAALKNPGSVGDQEAIDSLTKLANSGNAVTEAQVKLITGSRSLSDWAGVLGNKFRNGGALSQNQRDQIEKVADATFDAYEKGVAPVYEEATGKLKAAGIKPQFWPIMDVKSMSQKVRAALSAPPQDGSGRPSPAVGNRIKYDAQGNPVQ